MQILLHLQIGQVIMPSRQDINGLSKGFVGINPQSSYLNI